MLISELVILRNVQTPTSFVLNHKYLSVLSRYLNIPDKWEEPVAMPYKDHVSNIKCLNQ